MQARHRCRGDGETIRVYPELLFGIQKREGKSEASSVGGCSVVRTSVAAWGHGKKVKRGGGGGGENGGGGEARESGAAGGKEERCYFRPSSSLPTASGGAGGGWIGRGGEEEKVMSERGAALFSTRAMKWASWKVSFPPFPRQRLSVGRRSGGDGRSGGGKGRKKTKSSCFSPPVFFNVKVAWGSGWLAGGRARLACLLRRGMFVRG